jgi:exodeoxyribonuclease VII large subunit
VQEIPVYTVSQLATEISSLLQDGFDLIWVRGEVSNFRRSQNGHWYFDLKESGHLISAVMFSSANRAFAELTDGLYLMALGRLDFYGPWGATQLYCSNLRILGYGQDAQALDRLRAKLREEGLFDPSRKRPLPPFPGTIGIATSLQGAALRDVIKVVARRFPLATLVVSPTSVQGEDAPEQIVRSLRVLNQFPETEVILLVRGGGSSEDMAPFNSEVVTREVFASRVPVVTGVGHSIDLSLADLAADAVAITPTQAAELATPDIDQLKAEIASLARRAAAAAAEKIRQLREAMHPAALALSPHKLERKLHDLRLGVDTLTRRAELAVKEKMRSWRSQVSRLETAAAGCNPGLILNRGYALVRIRDTGHYLASAVEAMPSQSLSIIMRDGEIVTLVQEVLHGTPQVQLRKGLSIPTGNSGTA